MWWGPNKGGRRQGGWSLGSWRTGISELATFTGLFSSWCAPEWWIWRAGEGASLLEGRRCLWDSKWDFLILLLLCWPLNSPGGPETPTQAGIRLHTSSLRSPEATFTTWIIFFFKFYITALQLQTGRVYVLLVHQIWRASALNTDFKRRPAGFPSPCVFFGWWIINKVSSRCPVAAHCSRPELHVKMSNKCALTRRASPPPKHTHTHTHPHPPTHTHTPTHTHPHPK